MQTPAMADFGDDTDRKLAEVVVRVWNVKGSMSRPLQAIADMGVNVTDGVLKAPPTNPVGTLCIFADFKEAKVTVSEFKKQLLGVPFVESVEVLGPQQGQHLVAEVLPERWTGILLPALNAEALP